MACTSGSTGDTSTIYGCIKEVCKQAAVLVQKLIAAQGGVNSAGSVAQLVDTMNKNGAAVKCVVNGPVGTYCQLPEGSVLPTLAEKLDNLNACSIAGISGDSFTATAGQTQFMLSAAPLNDWSLEVSLDGAICRNPADYTVTGTTLTFTLGLDTGDTVETRSFSV